MDRSGSKDDAGGWGATGRSPTTAFPTTDRSGRNFMWAGAPAGGYGHGLAPCEYPNDSANPEMGRMGRRESGWLAMITPLHSRNPAQVSMQGIDRSRDDAGGL